MEVFCVIALGGLYLEGLIHGGAYFRNFTVFDVDVLVQHTRCDSVTHAITLTHVFFFNTLKRSVTICLLNFSGNYQK